MPKIINQDSILGDDLFVWDIPEYEENIRPKTWYIFMFVLALFFVSYALFTSNYLFSLIIILFSIIIFLQSIQKPIVVPFKITSLGIVLNNRFYKYSEFKDFYIIYEPKENLKMLFLETNGLKPKLRIPLLEMDPNKIRKTLENFLEENLEIEDEPLTDFVARKWKLH